MSKKQKKPPIAKHMREAGTGLAEIMKEKLTVMADDLIKQVMVKCRRSTPAQRINAIKGLSPRGVYDYKDAVKNAFSVMALDAIQQARKEVPKAKTVRLCESEDSFQFAEFDRLPPALQKKIKSKTDLLVGKQIGDLQKVVEFAYVTKEEETDSDDEVEADLNGTAVDWLDSTSMAAGAELNSASVINSARQAFFFDEEVLPELDAFEFVNGDPVTEICQDLAGTIFSKDDPTADQYYPPLHWNCKSFIVPILAGNLGDREIEKLKPSTKALDAEVQFHEKDCCHV